MSDFNIKQLHAQCASSNRTQFTQNGYKCELLKPRNGNARVSVQHKQTNVAKTVVLKPVKRENSKLFDWEPIIDGAAVIGDMIAPELAPFFHMGKSALKHWMKGGKKKKEKKEKHHESNFDKAFEGEMVHRNMQPFKQVAKTRAEALMEVPDTAHGVVVHPQQGATHVTAHDGKQIPVKEYLNWRATKVNPKRVPGHAPIMPLANRRTFKDAICQANLREILSFKRDPTDFEMQGCAPLDKLQVAKINPVSRLNASAVPILNGEMGTEMDMTPVTITKTENHAVIAGSELLGDLVIPPGGGVAGGVPIRNYINPRVFFGTKLAIESISWLMYRFTKFIIEYIPTIGANTPGAFIEYFSQDPDEETLSGLSQRRNAMVHDQAVPFQPFTYVVAGMTPKKQDKSLYYMSNNVGLDDRLVYQAQYILTNNAQNADSSTVPSYGSFVIHYECDFYYPALPPATTLGSYGNQTFSGNAAAAGALVGLTIGSTLIGVTEPGVVLMGVLGVGPTGYGACYFDVTDGNAEAPLAMTGSTYFLRVYSVSGGSAVCYLFNNLSLAINYEGAGSQGALRGGTAAPLSAGNWPFGNIQRLDPTLFSYRVQSQDPESDSSSSEDELTQSEIDLLKIKRKISMLNPTSEQLPTISIRKSSSPKI